MTLGQATEHMKQSLAHPLVELDDFQLSNLIPKGKEIFLYGGGDMGHKVYAEMRRLNVPVAGYMDRLGAGLLPIPYHNIEAADENDYSHAVAIICYVSNNYDDTIAVLKTIGFQNIIIPVNFFAQNQVFADDLRKNDLYIKNREEDIMDALNLLADDESRDAFCGLLRSYITKDFQKNVVCHKHFTNMDPLSIPEFADGYDGFIDCGAFDGDTLEDFLLYRGFLNCYIGFEPDLDSFKQLSAYVKSQRKNLGSAMIYPCAVSNQTGLTGFEASNTVSSKLSETGDAVVPIVKLDDVVHGIARDTRFLLKMDVEGHEAAVLDGAELLIKENKPDLMICLYHKMADLWELPLKVYKLSRGYHFYVRSYTGVAVDTILYALHRK